MKNKRKADLFQSQKPPSLSHKLKTLNSQSFFVFCNLRWPFAAQKTPKFTAKKSYELKTTIQEQMVFCEDY